MKKCRLVALVLLAVTLFFGCGKDHSVDKDVQLDKLFSTYRELSPHLGTAGKMETLDNLRIDLQQVNIESADHLGIPMQEQYAGLTFDVYINFNTKQDVDFFSGIEFVKQYRYPEQKKQLIADVKAVTEKMVNDFGENGDRSFTINWVETMLHEQWDPDIDYWQDPSILERLFSEGYCGELLWWDITPVVDTKVKSAIEEYIPDKVFGICPYVLIPHTGEGIAELRIIN